MRVRTAWCALALIFGLELSARASEPSQAFECARDAIERGDYAAGISTLERLLPGARGNEQALPLLRRAYRGEVRDLVARGDRKGAEKYLERLRLIENVPAARPDGTSERPVVAARARDSVPTAPRQPSPPRGELSGPPVMGAQTASPSEPAGSAAQARERQAESGWSAARLAKNPAPAASDTTEGAPPGPSVRVTGIRPTDKAPGIAADMPARHVTQADGLFRAGRYGEAGELYRKAHGADAATTPVIRDRWAYCRLVSVVNRLNSNPAAEEWGQIKAEMRGILELIPTNSYAQSLLQIVEDRSTREPRLPEKPAVVRASDQEVPGARTPNLLAGLASRISLTRGDDLARRSLWQRFRSGSWQVLETSNFRIHHSDEKLAGTAADVAERTRFELYRTWYGRDPERDWQPKCDIFIHSSADSYARVTGQGPASPGHSSTGLDRGRILSRRIDLRRDGPDLIYAVLPHEITHVVMADRFNHQPLPRWADEGTAVLTEPTEKKQAHLRNLQNASQNGRLFSARELMTMGDYPPGNMWGTFYAQSVSLVEFLVAQNGPTQFMEFMTGSLERGYESELKRVYGFASFQDLDRAWGQDRVKQVAAAVVETR